MTVPQQSAPNAPALDPPGQPPAEVLYGRREPTYLVLPQVDTIGQLADEAVEFCRSIGLLLDPWEEDVLRWSLAEVRPGEWAAEEIDLVVPRQNGKGAILEARELAGLWLTGEEMIAHSAHRVQIAREHQRRMMLHIENHRELERDVMRILQGNGFEQIELRNGARLLFVSRAKGSGRGGSGDCTVLDESYYLTDLAASTPALAAAPNPQVWFTSSHPLDDAPSTHLRSIVKRGRSLARSGADPGPLIYAEWCTTPDKAGTRQGLIEANPGLGYRVRERFVMNTERSALAESDWHRERFGIYDDQEGGAWAVIDLDHWRACHDRGSGMRGFAGLIDPVVMAVDCAPDRAWSAIAAAGEVYAQPGDTQPIPGIIGVELVDFREGTTWLADRAIDLQDRWTPRGWVLDPRSHAGSISKQMTDAGCQVREIKMVEKVDAWGSLLDAVETHTIAHQDQPDLTAAAAGAISRRYAEAELWDRQAGTQLCPLVAACLAAWGHTVIEEQRPRQVRFGRR